MKFYDAVKNRIPPKTRLRINVLGGPEEYRPKLLEVMDAGLLQRMLTLRDAKEGDPTSGTVSIAAGRTHELCLVAKTSSIIHWKFNVQANDIDFSVSLYEPVAGEDGMVSLDEKVVVETQRHPAEDGQCKGEYVVPDATQGINEDIEGSTRMLTLRWSNSYSWWNEKTVTFHVEEELEVFEDCDSGDD